MEEVDYIVSIIDTIMGSARKRHIIGGFMLSLSLFFAGVTVTIVTLKEEDSNE